MVSGGGRGTSAAPSADSNPESSLAADGIPSTALAAYQQAAQWENAVDPACQIPWPLLAAIGRVESDHGTSGGSRLGATGIATPAIYGPVLDGHHHTERVPDTDGGRLDGDKRFDRAVGPMQILPSTWVLIAVDGDGDGRRDPQDINDAALASAVYLCSTGTDLSGQDTQRSALLRYNHSAAYATEVLAVSSAYQSYDGVSGALPAVEVLPPLAGTESADDTASGGKHHHQKHHHKKHHHKKHKKAAK
jgi:membrane-bound lytic murein transglycosylase B